jgi:hypothetical protein
VHIAFTLGCGGRVIVIGNEFGVRHERESRPHPKKDVDYTESTKKLCRQPLPHVGI